MRDPLEPALAPNAPPRRIPCAIVGATGVVGQRFVELLHDHPWFDLQLLVGNDSAGQAYGDAVRHWLPDTPCAPAVRAQRVVPFADLLARTDIPLVFSALPGGIAGPLETELAQAGRFVFTNARDHRMAANVPLVVAELNADHLQLTKRQATPGAIVANGNCSAIGLQLPLAALHRAHPVTSCDVVTLQGLSGAGHPGVSALDALDNVIPYIAGEEDKLETEPNKTLGTLTPNGIQSAGIPIHATCTRVPVREGHTLVVHLRFAQATTLAAITQALEDFRGPADVQACPTAPQRPLHIHTAPDRPQPRRDRDAEGGMAVSVGRLRLDDDGCGVRFVTLSHNTLRGAAGQSVLNAEVAAIRGLLPGSGQRLAGNLKTR